MTSPNVSAEAPILSSAELQQIYKSRFTGNSSYRAKVWSVLIRDYFQQWVRPGDTVLDLGAGYGEFINQVACTKKYAMDLNPDTKEYANKDVQVLMQDCSKEWAIPESSLDVIFTSNFFEHLPDKQQLADTLGQAERCLKPGGLLIALGPNIKYLPGTYWDFIDHYVPLTEMSLSEAMTQKGFTIEKSFDKFLPYTMVGGPQYPLFFISAYLRLPLAWKFFGKQFLVVGKKKGGK